MASTLEEVSSAGAKSTRAHKQDADELGSVSFDGSMLLCQSLNQGEATTNTTTTATTITTRNERILGFGDETSKKTNKDKQQQPPPAARSLNQASVGAFQFPDGKPALIALDSAKHGAASTCTKPTPTLPMNTHHYQQARQANLYLNIKQLQQQQPKQKQQQKQQDQNSASVVSMRPMMVVGKEDDDDERENNWRRSRNEGEEGAPGESRKRHKVFDMANCKSPSRRPMIQIELTTGDSCKPQTVDELKVVSTTTTTTTVKRQVNKRRLHTKEQPVMVAAAPSQLAVAQRQQTTVKRQLQASATSISRAKTMSSLVSCVLTINMAIGVVVLVLVSCTLSRETLASQQVVTNTNRLLSSRKLSAISALNPSTSGTSGGGGGGPVTSASSALSHVVPPGGGIPGNNNGKLLVCYYTNWSQYRPKEGKYVPEDIDPHLCTHVIVAFGWMKKNRLAPFDASDESKDGKKGLYERVTSLKLANPNLKVLIAVGGWSFGTDRFKTMAANRYNRQLFIFSALEFLRERNFDGLDIDWEFPTAADKKNFVDLLKELRDAFDAEAKEKRLPKLLLTCAVSAGSETVKSGYDVAPIGQYVDFINIMSYDFHGKWESKTGHNAPLFASASETEWRKQLSMDFGVKLWERMGAPKSKLVIGLATYGRSFTLANNQQYGMNAPTTGGGKAGEFTREAGFLAFYEICDMLKQGASYHWDEEQAVPYAVHGDQWVGFDDELSIRNKVKWLNDQGYAGAMVWALDMDDFKGTCTPKKYPLIRAMAEGLFGLPARPSQEWRVIIEAARARAAAAATSNALAAAAGTSVAKVSPGGAAGAAGGAPSAEITAAAAAAAAAVANSILSSAGINNPATADAIRSAIIALGPTGLAGPTGQASADLASQLKNIPGLNVTSLLSSPGALSALALAAASQNRTLESTNARIVCYYTNWSYKRPGAGRFGPEHLDPQLCTHIIYAFYGLKDSKLVPTEDIDQGDNEQAPYRKIVALKQVNPNLKVMLAVGGWMIGYAPFRQLTENAFRQTSFVFDVIEFLRKRNFDGLDLCWEFPRGLDDKEKFSNLVKELRESFDGEAKSSGKPRLLLSAAVPASFEAISAGYDVPTINKYLDFMNVMTYDFHGDWEQVVGHNSPLFPLNSATPYQKKLTLDFSAGEWVRQGASKENLVIGLPTYGRTFTLANPNLTDIDAPASRGGRPGQYTKESGFLSFFEVCELLKSQATLVWDNEQMIPYAYKGDQWVGFDDPRSFKMKVQWLKQNGYSGIMIWSVDMDDFAGTCMGLRFPLIKSAKEELKGYYVPNLVESAQGSSLHTSINAKDKDELQCEETDGHITYHKDKKDCTMYYMCEGSRKHHMPCPQNLVFNQNENVCDWPENVEGCGTKLPAATPAAS
uniref:Putative chitinase 3 n=1 Tax=Aceria tosichella TaxID=561515 RepID=A0A6G1SIN4_9ACAR